MKLPDEGINLTLFIKELETDLIMQALERTNQNRTKASKLLGVRRTMLVERLRPLGLLFGAGSNGYKIRKRREK